jgi:tetratricopeptide (TPR) repeat protein
MNRDHPSADVEKARDLRAFYKMLSQCWNEAGADRQSELNVRLGEQRVTELLNCNGAEPSWAEGVRVARILRLPASAFILGGNSFGNDFDKAVGELNWNAAQGGQDKLQSALHDIRKLATKYRSMLSVVIAVGALGFAGIQTWNVQIDRSSINGQMQALEETSLRLTQLARDQSARGEIQAAFASHDHAISLARQRLLVSRDARTRQAAQYDLAQAVFWQADLAYRQGSTEQAQSGYEEYATLADALYEAEPSNPAYQAEKAWAGYNLAIMDFEHGEIDRARRGFELARNQLAALHGLDAGVSVLDVADATGWISVTLSASGQFSDAINLRAEQISLIESAGPLTPRSQLKRLNAQRDMAQLALSTGETQTANALSMTALSRADAFLAANPGDVRATRHYAALTALRATIALSEGRNLVAKLLIDEARARITSEIGGDRVSPWREAASLALVAAEVAVATSAGEAAMVEAENALTILAEDELGHVDTAIMKARAYELQGEAFLLLGNESLADRAFRMGLAELAPSTGHALENPVRARLAHRVGDLQTAQDALQALSLTDYADPRDAVYWGSIGASATARLQPSNGEHDG